MEELKVLLDHFGYKGELKALPRQLEEKENVKSFMKWVVGELESCTKLTGESKRRFDEMRQKGCCYDELELKRESVRTKLEHNERIRKLREEACDLMEEMKPLSSQLEVMSNVHNGLSAQYKECVNEQERLTSCLSECQRQYQQSHQELKALNTKANDALKRLQASVEGVMELYQSQDNKGEVPKLATPISLADCSQSDYHEAESRFLKQLTLLAKRQFSQGVSAARVSEGEPLDLSDRGQELDSTGIHLKHKQELERLQNILPLCEYQRISNVIMTSYIEAATRRAQEEEELRTVQEGRRETDRSPEELREAILTAESKVAEIREKLERCSRERLIPLIQDMTSLQVTQVLQGNHDAKLAKQRLFTNKQEETIKHLNSQRARFELLSMLLEVELHRHRNCSQLVRAATAHLEKCQEESKRRSDELEGLTPPQRTADGAKTISQLLGVSEGSGNIQEAQSQLLHSISVKESELSSLVKDQETLISEALSLYSNIHGHVYVENEATPSFRPKDFEESLGNLEAILDTLELNIKDLLKNHSQKKTAIQVNPLAETERTLFVHFFLNPTQLHQLMAELNAKVDSRVTTNAVLKQHHHQEEASAS